MQDLGRVRLGPAWDLGLDLAGPEHAPLQGKEPGADDVVVEAVTPDQAFRGGDAGEAEPAPSQASERAFRHLAKYRLGLPKHAHSARRPPAKSIIKMRNSSVPS